MAEPLLIAWSGGKDAATALVELASSDAWRCAGLLTTFVGEGERERVPMHDLPRALVEAQARALDLQLVAVRLPEHPSNPAYGEAMAGALLAWRRGGGRHVAFGDLHLADLRAWREHNLASLGMAGVFPLWGRPPRELARTAHARGIRAVVCCVDERRLGAEFLGRTIDERFLADLPADVDPCGENGEYHSFVTACPLFAAPITVRTGGIRRESPYARLELGPG